MILYFMVSFLTCFYLLTFFDVRELTLVSISNMVLLHVIQLFFVNFVTLFVNLKRINNNNNDNNRNNNNNNDNGSNNNNNKNKYNNKLCVI